MASHSASKGFCRERTRGDIRSSFGLNLVSSLDAAFDHADGDELGETRCTWIGALRADPVDNMGDRVDSDLDPAVILARGLEPIDLAGRCCFEVTFDVGMQRLLVVLHGQKIVTNSNGISHND